MRMWERVRNLRIENNLVFGSWLKPAEDVFNSVGGVESVVAARTLTAADSGKTFILNLAGGFTVTLPAPKLGLRFRFIAGIAPTTAYVIATAGGADIMKGHIIDVGATAVSDDNADKINFAANVALPGDEVELISDGSVWFFRGTSRADGGFTTSTT